MTETIFMVIWGIGAVITGWIIIYHSMNYKSDFWESDNAIFRFMIMVGAWPFMVIAVGGLIVLMAVLAGPPMLMSYCVEKLKRKQ